MRVAAAFDYLLSKLRIETTAVTEISGFEDISQL
ncbi:hypothetical protein Xen7305DRAFT_00019760 [Xenococcus sp. PCC 7305]|nr:hypothetical protein Xen7305DRAFT_00019760 [Xenococcus sp. PCC 7305]